jgi:hypothetical protein
MLNKTKYHYLIGIDCGVKTGFCVYDRLGKMIRVLKTMKIHQAMEMVRTYHLNHRGKVHVTFEDARLVRYKVDDVKAQGAGSVKRDASVWEGFLSDNDFFPGGIDFEMKRPNPAATKKELDESTWRRITRWEGPASEHARDASMLVWGY